MPYPDGKPRLATLVQYARIVAASCACDGDSATGNGAVGRVNRYCNSDACAAPYGKLTGGSSGCGAFSSANSYAKTGTYRDAAWSTVSAGQAKRASVPAAPSARAALG